MKLHRLPAMLLSVGIVIVFASIAVITPHRPNLLTLEGAMIITMAVSMEYLKRIKKE